MPRLPVDGKKVIEHRITLGTLERTILQDFATSYRIDSISGNDSIVEVMADTGKIIAALGTLGAILELLGITDVFDFDDDAKAQVMEVKEKIGKSIKETATDPSFLQEIFGIGINPGSYVAKEVYDRVK